MEHEFLTLEIILWISVMIALLIGVFIIYTKYKKDKIPYTLGIMCFFALFLLSRVCSFINFYWFNYRGELYLVEHPTWLWLQIGYNFFSYAGGFILYFVLEKYIIKTKFIFSGATVGGAIISILNYLTIEDLTLISIPFYLLVLFGFPLIYFYLAIKSTGKVRKDSLLIGIGILFFEIGMAFAIPEAQQLIWANFMYPLIYELGGPIFHLVGEGIMLKGFLGSE